MQHSKVVMEIYILIITIWFLRVYVSLLPALDEVNNSLFKIFYQ